MRGGERGEPGEADDWEEYDRVPCDGDRIVACQGGLSWSKDKRKARLTAGFFDDFGCS